MIDWDDYEPDYTEPERADFQGRHLEVGYRVMYGAWREAEPSERHKYAATIVSFEWEEELFVDIKFDFDSDLESLRGNFYGHKDQVQFEDIEVLWAA